MGWFEDYRGAIGLLTRLPGAAAEPGPARCWPLAGVTVALLAGAVGWAGLRLGLPPGLAAALVIGAHAVLTGALHEDGLSDTADGLWGGATRDRRLEIMKDSRVGSYGVLALVVTVLARWSALAALFSGGLVWGPLIAVAALSRAAMAGVMAALPPARTGGMSATLTRPDMAEALTAALIAFVIALLFCGWGAVAMTLAAGAAAWGIGALAREKIGGQTGDILGAAQQMAELAALSVAVALL